MDNFVKIARLYKVPRRYWWNEWIRWAEAWDRQITGAWLSTNLVVVRFAEPKGIIRLSIYHRDWGSGISWDELQRIKSVLGYSNREAVEIYPRDKQVVNRGNMRHIWILKKPLPFSWRKNAD